ncbi:polysaccharide deacetylase family protein [Bacterioplanoides sp.]|uniref:polysaccharide deacetylase family protein n=1 Tax=Bacterioplanoides sp. TaxID=2066072 RepID=UPI003B5A98B9
MRFSHHLGLLLFSLLFAPLSQALVILQYHHIDATTPPVTSISPEKFEQHMQLLESEGMQVVDLKSALQTLQNGGELPHKAVAITFDDAWESIYLNAFPLMKQRNWPFTIFVNTQAVDEKHKKVASWEQLAEMQEHGGTMANHSHSHPYLIEKPADLSLDQWLTKEVTGPEQRIQKKLGVSHKMLAYPYGEFDSDIANWLKVKGYIAFGQQSGPVGKHSHFQALPRFPAAGIYANPKTLKTKLKTLAFPIPPEQLIDPILAENNPPELTLSFVSNDLYRSQIQCFASGEGAIKTEAKAKKILNPETNKKDQHISIVTQAEKPITAGRGRYNCTAASKKHKGFYYWYSQVWINTDVKKR